MSPYMRGTRVGEPAGGKPRSVLATGAFWLATGERAVKTAAQAAVTMIGTNAIGITEIDWAGLGSVAAFAGFASALSSLASAGIGNSGPSLASEELAPTPPADEPDDAPEPV